MNSVATLAATGNAKKREEEDIERELSGSNFEKQHNIAATNTYAYFVICVHVNTQTHTHTQTHTDDR